VTRELKYSFTTDKQEKQDTKRREDALTDLFIREMRRQPAETAAAETD